MVRARDLEMTLLSQRLTRAWQAIVLQLRHLALREHVLRRKGRVHTRTMLLEAV